MFCALLMSRYQVSVYGTNGPLVIELSQEGRKLYIREISLCENDPLKPVLI